MKYIFQEYTPKVDSSGHWCGTYSGSILEVDDDNMAIYLFYSHFPGQFYPAAEVAVHNRFCWPNFYPPSSYKITEYATLEDLIAEHFIDFL